MGLMGKKRKKAEIKMMDKGRRGDVNERMGRGGDKSLVSSHL